jgi:hypothetical protein
MDKAFVCYKGGEFEEWVAELRRTELSMKTGDLSIVLTVSSFQAGDQLERRSDT